MFDFFKKNRNIDKLLYEYIYKEIENTNIDKSIWTKAIALSNGNSNKIEPNYIKERLISLKDEIYEVEKLTNIKMIESTLKELLELKNSSPSLSILQVFNQVKEEKKRKKELEQLKIEEEKRKRFENQIISDYTDIANYGYTVLSKISVRKNGTFDDYKLLFDERSLCFLIKNEEEIIDKFYLDKRTK